MYSYKTKHGRYQLHFENQILYTEASGIVDLPLSRHFTKDFCALIDESKGSEAWGHCLNLSKCDIYTEESFAELVFPSRYAYANGCVIDVFQVSSPVLIDQLGKMRQAVGVADPATAHFFNTQQQCIEFLHIYLAKK